MILMLTGIVVGAITIIVLVILIIRCMRQNTNPTYVDSLKKKVVVNEHGADVNSGNLGSGSLFRGFGQENSDTICMSQELVQQKYFNTNTKHIRLKECETGHIWESVFITKIYIGRKPNPKGENSIVISYSGISAQHCQLYLNGEMVMVNDLHSTNGTFLNNDIIKSPRQIRNGDILGLGIKKFQVELWQN